MDKAEFLALCKDFAYPSTNDKELRVNQFQAISEALVPGFFEWHEWTDKIINACVRRRWIAECGCSSSGKTFNTTGFACTWWNAAPEDSSVILCSTTMKSLRKRAWAVVQAYKEKVNQVHGDYPGNFVNSQTIWQAAQGDDQHGIFGMAVAEGDISKAAANIQGIHTRRQMVIIDEAEAVPAAIWTSAFNLWSYPVDSGGEFIFIAIANPRSRLSRFGRYIEPAEGWEKVSVDSDDWESMPQLDGKRALVLRFDKKKSPNYVSEVAVSKHLPSKRSVNARFKALSDKGGGENDPEMWAMDRGFPAPEGLNKTVFTAVMLSAAGAHDKLTFTGRNFFIIGAFDPAYGGGDRPALRFAAMGEIAHEVLGIEMMDPILLFADATNMSRPVRYQLVDQLKEHCNSVTWRGQKYVCNYENLGVDTTGDGGVADIAQQERMTGIIRIMFSGAPSEDPVSIEDERPANTVYKNKRAEMFFRLRNGTQSGQVKGIDKDTAEELCQLEYFDKRPDGTLKPITIIDKVLYKERYQKSPDLADTSAMLLEVARQKGFRLKAIGSMVEFSAAFGELAAKAQEVYHDVNYSADNEQTEEEELYGEDW